MHYVGFTLRYALAVYLKVEQSLQERDKAMRENHELRERLGAGQAKTGSPQTPDIARPASLAGGQYRNASTDGSKRAKEGEKDDADPSSDLDPAVTTGGVNKVRLDNLDQANAEIERLRKMGDKLSGELQGNYHSRCVFCTNFW